MLNSTGLRLAFAGGGVFLAGALSMLLLPYFVGVTAMLIGGMGVWCGFIVTMFSWYAGGDDNPAP